MLEHFSGNLARAIFKFFQARRGADPGFRGCVPVEPWIFWEIAAFLTPFSASGCPGSLPTT